MKLKNPNEIKRENIKIFDNIFQCYSSSSMVDKHTTKQSTWILKEKKSEHTRIFTKMVENSPGSKREVWFLMY